MFAACPAVLRELFAKMFARAVKPHGKIIFGQAKRDCDGGGIIAAQVNTLKQLAVLLRHGRQQSFETLAEHTLIVSSRGEVKPLFKLFERSLACVIPAVKVNNRPAENPIEPCDGILPFFGCFAENSALTRLSCTTSSAKCASPTRFRANATNVRRFFSKDSSICFTAEF